MARMLRIKTITKYNFRRVQKELENFIEAAQGKVKPIVDGTAGKNALDLALQIHNKILEDIQ